MNLVYKMLVRVCASDTQLLGFHSLSMIYSSMGNQVDNKFTWVIKNFSTLQATVISSDPFMTGGYKWRVLAYPKGLNKSDYFSLFLEVVDYKSLPPLWRIHARYLLTIVNQNSEENSKRIEANKWFDQKIPGWGLSAMIHLTKLDPKDGGFLVNNELKIVAEVDVLEVIDKLDVTKESEEAATTQPLKKMKIEDDNPSDVLKETSSAEESMDVNGFQVLPSQADFVRRIFEKHPDIAVEFRPKNQHLRKACLNFLLSLIETLCQSPQELSNEDLVEANNALTCIKVSGFQVDWLEKKLEEVKEKKKDEEISETRMQELEVLLNKFKHKCLHIEALMEKEKAKVLAARIPLRLDDVV